MIIIVVERWAGKYFYKKSRKPFEGLRDKAMPMDSIQKLS